TTPPPPPLYPLSLHDALPIWAHHPVGQRLGVAVGVVRGGTQRTGAIRFVADERDRCVVAAERGTGQGQPAPRGGERLAHPVAPRSEEHTSELQSQSNLVCRLL